MLDTNQKIDHDAIMRDARQLRAETMAELGRTIAAFFRPKADGVAVKA
jgi:hypothetical protein